MNIFISGGCKNGKSMYAQKLAQKMAQEKNVPLYYLATMKPKDSEDDERVLRHQQDRDGWGFITIEQPVDVCKVLDEVDPKGVFLFDSVTALLENEMFDKDFNLDLESGNRTKNQVIEFAQRTGNTVFVSDFIYSDSLDYDETTEFYRSQLAMVDKALAQICNQVVEVTFGNIIEYK
ncbi:MAG: bifunctional adenosylcobinamide kinase/adenosylcobinamide-phosphate guanylyltransferase [Eubacterium sp.]|nr:bifunctional adenosylcobinamide kinase/adenosylcobinamide-phosphate guanylyltransferase [Eubacterium sp.]